MQNAPHHENVNVNLNSRTRYFSEDSDKSEPSANNFLYLLGSSNTVVFHKHASSSVPAGALVFSKATIVAKVPILFPVLSQ